MLMRRKKDKDRYLYLISGGGLIKIGIADDVQKRIKTLNLASPVPLELVASFFVSNAMSVEGELHRHFSDKRVRGEWFDLSRQDIEWILSRFS
jgi:hypothetical protein